MWNKVYKSGKNKFYHKAEDQGKGETILSGLRRVTQKHKNQMNTRKIKTKSLSTYLFNIPNLTQHRNFVKKHLPNV